MMITRFCVYCTEHEYCNDYEQFMNSKCKRFQGNLDYSLKIKIIRFFYWIFHIRETEGV